jgi:hypothetical protein
MDVVGTAFIVLMMTTDLYHTKIIDFYTDWKFFWGGRGWK